MTKQISARHRSSTTGLLAAPDMTDPATPVTRIAVDLLNIEAGCLQPDGRYDFDLLVSAFSGGRAFDLLLLNEAKFWYRRGEQPFLDAIKRLSRLLDRPYVGELFTAGGGLGNAVIYDPRLLCLESGEETSFTDKHNRAVFSVRGKPRRRFRLLTEHWPYSDKRAAYERARLLGQFGIDPMPTLAGGDLNRTASGPHLPQRDWEQVPLAVRDYKARRLPDGTWVADTRALDRLLGPWDEATGGRVPGYGWHALCELAAASGTPPSLAYAPTTNHHTDRGGELVIDWLLINDAWKQAGGLVPGTYQVHVPPGTSRADFPSDHRRISAVLALAA